MLQLKRGSIRPAYFAGKYGVDILSRFDTAWAVLRGEGYLERADEDLVRLTRDGLMRVDTLLPRFFLPEHQSIRYT